jgi:modulator of FtsH protease HflC
MKRNALTLVVGVILLIIFFLLLFTFQVRQTEVVVLTTFAKPSANPIEQPGLYFKWPAPIQRVYRLDKRIHNFEDAFDQNLTYDHHSLLASVYVGWTIERPLEFFNSFAAGRPEAARPQIESLVRFSKQAIIGKYPFTDFISSEGNNAKFSQIEAEMLQNVRQAALEKYGVNIRFLGFKRLGIPESVTSKVFDRMTAERQRAVDAIKAEGQRQAIAIRSAADRERSDILSQANAEAIRIRGEAEKQATEAFRTFDQNPTLALYLLELQALEKTLSKGTTLIVNPNMRPFNLLMLGANNGTNLSPLAPEGTRNRPSELSSNR